MTHVMARVCNSIDTTEMYNCEGFHVLPVESAYTIRYRENGKFFKPEYRAEVMERMNGSIVAHVWNKLSAERKLTVESDVAYIHLAREYCPKVLEASIVF